MRRLASLSGVAVASMVSLLAASAPASADQVAVSQPWNGISVGYCVDPQQSMASTFVPTASGKAQTASVWLQSDSAARTISAQILSANDDGSPGATVLGTTTVTAPADSGFGVHQDDANFDSGPVLHAGDTYVLALSSSDQAENCLPGWSFSSSGGTAWFSNPAVGSSWQPIDTGVPQLDHTAFALTVSVDTPPNQPAAPSSDQSLNSDGHQTVSWSPTVDPDGDSIDHYVLQHKRSDQSSFSDVGSVTGSSYRFGADGPAEDEGTWTYRVIAVDSNGNASVPSDPSASVVVDKTPPAAPSAAADPAPAYADAAGDAWYKDSVRVSFTDNGDPGLADGSPGSGVASVTSPKTFDGSDVDPGTGAFSIDGTASDNAGNVSAAKTVSGYVDWRAPVSSFKDCPTTPVLLGSSQSVDWAATDPQPSSGLATQGSGTIALDTSTAGAHTVNAPAPSDNVGHTGNAASCAYTVDYEFSGFSAPLRNGPSVNTGHGGRTYPVKWQLTDAAGRQITALSAIRALTYKATSCAAFSSDSAGSVPAGASGASGLRNDGGQYTFNWSTPGTGCYTLFLTLDSGQVLPVYFALS